MAPDMSTAKTNFDQQHQGRSVSRAKPAYAEAN